MNDTKKEIQKGHVVVLRVMATCDIENCKRRPSACVVCVAKKIRADLNDLGVEITSEDETTEETSEEQVLVGLSDWSVARSFYEVEHKERNQV